MEVAARSSSRSRGKSAYAKLLLEEVSKWLGVILEAATPSTSVNIMVAFKQNVILTDNQYLCINQNNLGVILPFYGSSSFVGTATFQTAMKEDPVMYDIRLLSEKLGYLAGQKAEVYQNDTENVNMVRTLYDNLKDNPHWIPFLKYACLESLLYSDHIQVVSQLQLFLLNTASVETAYEALHNVLMLAVQKNDLYSNLLSSLARNEVTLLQNTTVSDSLKQVIKKEVFDVAVLLARLSMIDIGLLFFSHFHEEASLLEYCGYFYDFITNIPECNYTMKGSYELWTEFITFFRNHYNQWKDIPSNESFSLYLLKNESPENRLLLLRYFSSFIHFAILLVSLLLRNKQRSSSYLYGLFYLIVLLSFILLESFNNHLVSANVAVYSEEYATLLQIADEFHSFIVTQSSICSENNGSYLLLQLALLASSPFAISGEHLKSVYQCLRCLFNLTVMLDAFIHF